MSDLLGILNVGGKSFHLVDWDRPVWFDPADRDGLRVVPDPDHFVADLIAVMCLNVLQECGQACGRAMTGLNVLSGPQCEHVEEARRRIYSDFKDPLICMYPGEHVDGNISRDLARFKRSPMTLARLDEAPSKSGERVVTHPDWCDNHSDGSGNIDDWCSRCEQEVSDGDDCFREHPSEVWHRRVVGHFLPDSIYGDLHFAAGWATQDMITLEQSHDASKSRMLYYSASADSDYDYTLFDLKDFRRKIELVEHVLRGNLKE